MAHKKSKDKNSIDAQKAFNKVQYSFIINDLKNLGREGMYVIIIKAIYNKTFGQHYIKWEKMKNISSKTWNKTRGHTVLSLI